MTSAALDTPPDDARDEALRELIRRRVAAAGTSFYWAMRLLPALRRDAMYAIYAFCREVDDIADDDRPLDEKHAALAEWRDEIARLYAGAPLHPVSRALRGPVARYVLRRGDFEAVIDGMAMDAETAICAPDLATLDLYCSRVAGAVGHLSVHAFGDSSVAAHEVADALGRALQLTNILRDLDEDARRGRLYLPRELLDRHGIRSDAPNEVLRHPALPAVCRDLAEIAERHFADAEAAMGRCSRRAMRPAAVMGAFYRAMLHALVASDWRDLRVRVGLSKPKKLWLVLRHGFV